MCELTKTKTCGHCKETKSISEFNKDAGNPDGVRCYCRACGKTYWRRHADKNRETLNARARVFRAHNPERVRARVTRSDLKRKFGLTPESKKIMERKQGGACAICRLPFSSSFNTHIDHIHGATPVVIRGLLCARCNTGLGQFKDSISNLQNAIDYLSRFKNGQVHWIV
jgi:hypothetical protein